MNLNVNKPVCLDNYVDEYESDYVNSNFDLNLFNFSSIESNGQTSLNKSINNMFKKINNLKQSINLTKLSKSNKSKVNKFNAVKFDKKPLITVKHNTVTKNNVKLFVNNNLDVNKKVDCNFAKQDAFTSSLQLNRNIEEVRSKSETKLLTFHNENNSKTKSENFYFLECQTFENLKKLHKFELNLEKIQQKVRNFESNPSEINQTNIANNYVQSNKKQIVESLLRNNNYLNENKMNTKILNENSFSNLIVKNSDETSLKLPSYVGISCAISGYGTYNKYLGNSSEGNSPATLIKRMNLNYIPLSNHHSFNPSSNQDLNQDSKHLDNYSNKNKTNFKNMNSNSKLNTVKHNLDCVDNQLNNHNLSLPCENLIKKKHIENNKSLIQERIESLYGQSFASNWKESRTKLKIDKLQKDSFRSPSCPPELIINFATKKNLPVLKYITNNYSSNSNFDNKISSVNSSNGNYTKNKFILNENNIKLDNNLENHDEKIVKNKTNKPQTNDLVNKHEEQLEKKDNDLSSNERQDGVWYLKKLNNEIDKIKVNISKVELIDLDSNLENYEELQGKIRSAIGKANLLINQKLFQFRNLCNKNINQIPDDDYQTLDKDLEGFWEMVLYQIEDVNSTLNEILFLRENNWKLNPEIKNLSPRYYKPRDSKNSSRCNSKPSSRNVSREDLRKSKLREVKKRQQMLNSNNQQNDQILIFLPADKNEKI